MGELSGVDYRDLPAFLGPGQAAEGTVLVRTFLDAQIQDGFAKGGAHYGLALSDDAHLANGLGQTPNGQRVQQDADAWAVFDLGTLTWVRSASTRHEPAPYGPLPADPQILAGYAPMAQQTGIDVKQAWGFLPGVTLDAFGPQASSRRQDQTQFRIMVGEESLWNISYYMDYLLTTLPNYEGVADHLGKLSPNKPYSLSPAEPPLKAGEKLVVHADPAFRGVPAPTGSPTMELTLGAPQLNGHELTVALTVVNNLGPGWLRQVLLPNNLVLVDQAGDILVTAQDAQVTVADRGGVAESDFPLGVPWIQVAPKRPVTGIVRFELPPVVTAPDGSRVPLSAKALGTVTIGVVGMYGAVYGTWEFQPSEIGGR